jgi:hypothetical protein
LEGFIRKVRNETIVFNYLSSINEWSNKNSKENYHSKELEES